MGTHPIFESDFDCLTDERWRKVEKIRKNRAVRESLIRGLNLLLLNLILSEAAPKKENGKRKQRKSRKRHRKIGKRRKKRNEVIDPARDRKVARRKRRREKIRENRGTRENLRKSRGRGLR